MKNEPTTERIIAENYQSDEGSYLIYLMHIATYKYSLNFVSGMRVLDFGCGSGYGTSLISDACKKITGADISPEAVKHARSHFKSPNLDFVQIEKVENASLPFDNASFDVVLSFQVIEHVEDVVAYLREIDRVIVPGGTVLISTPDRSSRLFFFQKPWNMWHLREYTRLQLRDELATWFTNVIVKQIGGPQDILQIELNRTKRLRWLLLPITLPVTPEFVRRKGLKFIKFLKYNLFPHSNQPVKHGFNEKVFSISEKEDYSIDLLAIANKIDHHKEK